ncbi:hypothetical protein ATCC90586_004807 [Pythium insidiosum]|nr:hypothetical protein ATCC90586_004807 [Pythium insidiosum]
MAETQDLTLLLDPRLQSQVLATSIGNAVVTTPLQVIKCRLQYERPSFGAALVPVAAAATVMPQYIGPNREPVPAETVGALATATFATGFALMLPFDMLATRLHAMPSPAGRAFQTLRSEAQLLLAQHGLRGFFAGGMTSVLSSGVGASAGMLAFLAFSLPGIATTP